MNRVRTFLLASLVLPFVLLLTAHAQRGKAYFHPQHPASGVHTDGEVRYTVGPAQLYFFIVGATGVNTAPSSLVECGASANVGGPDANGNCWETVDATGNFNLTGDYECPNDTADTSLVYLVVKNAAINGRTTQNPYFTNVSALPYTCGYLQQNGGTVTGLVISDFTTVAAAVEAAPFLNTTASLGDGFGVALTNTASYNALSNAFAAANSFLAGGYYDDSDQTIQTQLDTYGDMVGLCSIDVGSGYCTQLNSTAPQWASTTVNDPWQALVGVVQSPSSSTTTNVLYLTPPTPPYNPNYTNVPTGGLRLSLPGAPFIPTCLTANQRKGTRPTLTVNGLTAGSSIVVVAYGQAYVTGATDVTTTSVTFTVPLKLGKGAVAVYQNGVASNACEINITS